MGNPTIQSRFEAKKRKILEQLDTPDELYHDLSPKGSVDRPIRTLIGDINRHSGLVTTSSCSGRVSVFLEGKRRSDIAAEKLENEDGSNPIAGPGGKGGGSWLHISHDPVPIPEPDSGSTLLSLCGMVESKSTTSPDSKSRFIHLKFEPMILHILTASLEDSQRVLAAALSSGFRESGAVGLTAIKTGEMNPMVAIRSTGYSFDAIIGYQDDDGDNVAMVDEKYLSTLIHIANDRFKTNTERINRLSASLHAQYTENTSTHSLTLTKKAAKADWEDPEARRQRKREEGLARQRALKTTEAASPPSFPPEGHYETST